METRSLSDPAILLTSEISQTELAPHLTQTLTSKDFSRLTCVNRAFNVFFKPELHRCLAEELLTHVLKGDAAKAKAMYMANPALLFIEVKGTEWASGFVKETDIPVHRTVQMSPLRAMAAAGDQWMLKEALQVLESYIDQDTKRSGTSLAAEQIQQQFPNGFNYPPSTYDFSPLVTAISNDQQLIATGNPSEATKILIEKFRTDFMPGVVKSGYLFNLNDLIKALELYDQNYDPWDGNQLRFFWCQVVGFLERLVPAVFAQAVSQGITNVLEGKPFQRTLSFHNYVTNKPVSFFPLDADLTCRLGLGFGVDSYCSGPPVGLLAPRPWVARAACVFVQTYVEQHQRAWKDLCCHCSSNSETRPQQMTSGYAVRFSEAFQ